MKIKMDFVTNSSSTSYVVWGVELLCDKLKEMTVLMGKVYNDYVEYCQKYNNPILEYDAWINQKDSEVLESIRQFIEHTDLEVYVPEYDSVMYIGESPFNVANNQTGKQFKDSIITEMQSLGIEVEATALTSIEEINYDG